MMMDSGFTRDKAIRMDAKAARESKTAATGPGGVYIYCIGAGPGDVRLGKVGIEESDVYTLGYIDIAAVVHDCQKKSYELNDTEDAKSWIISHQKVVDMAMDRFSSVLPVSFGNIITGDREKSPGRKVKEQLKDNYSYWKEKLERVRDKAEYGVQIFWDPALMAARILEEVFGLKSLKEEANGKIGGAAFLYEEKLRKRMKEEMEARAGRFFKEFYAGIKGVAADVRIDRTAKTFEGKRMIVNASCLLYPAQVQALGMILDGIKKDEVFYVRLTGPWPPYSFV